MALFDHNFKNISDYYDSMYMDGHKPEQIMHAARKKMIRAYKERKAAQRTEAEANEIPYVKIISEVKIR